MSVARPPSRIKIDMPDRALFEEIVNAGPLPIELFGRRWRLVDSQWEGFSRSGTVVLIEIVDETNV